MSVTKIVFEGKSGHFVRHMLCLNCECELRTEYWDYEKMFGSNTILKDNTNPDYCPKCGKRVHWDD